MEKKVKKTESPEVERSGTGGDSGREGNETINFNGKVITLRSEDGAENTIIEGNGSGTVVTFTDSIVGGNSTIEGLTITGGGPGDAMSGITCAPFSTPIIRDCIITGNVSGGGAGISIGDYSAVVIENCTIENNVAEFKGGGIYILHASATIRDCIIRNNTATKMGGGGIYVWLAAATTKTTNTDITDNVVLGANSGYGGGISAHFSPLEIDNCNISRNSVESAGGGIVSDCSRLLINNSIIKGNSASKGGGLFISQDPVWPREPHIITNCVISGNTAYGEPNFSYSGDYLVGGGGINVWYDAKASFINCTITDNYFPGVGSAVSTYDDSRAYFTNCIFWGNYGTDYSVWMLNDAYTTITHSIIDENKVGYDGGYPVMNYTYNSDPLFADGGNYHITPGSPCINKAKNSVAPGDDIDGDSRPYGGSSDIGADEYTGCMDFDGDGYYAWGGCGTSVDCDDLSDNIYPDPNILDICDGKDNDCDPNSTDGSEETAPLNSIQAGVCEGSINSCGGFDGWIDDYNGVSNYEAIEISCDNLDNNCNGQTDEDLILDCGPGVGECHNGYKTCTNGSWGSCEGVTGPIDEICDGKDNNCDGVIDENACRILPSGAISYWAFDEGSGTVAGRCYR